MIKSFLRMPRSPNHTNLNVRPTPVMTSLPVFMSMVSLFKIRLLAERDPVLSSLGLIVSLLLFFVQSACSNRDIVGAGVGRGIGLSEEVWNFGIGAVLFTGDGIVRGQHVGGVP